MSTPTVSEFRAFFQPIFSSLVDYTDEQILFQLEQAKIEVQPCPFGKYYRRALYYLTAHFLTIFKEMAMRAQSLPAGSSAISASRGVVASTSVGDLSLTKEMPEYNSSSDDKYLASTIFGQEFIRLRNKVGRGVLLARDPIIMGGCNGI